MINDNVTEVKNAQYMRADHSLIDVEITLSSGITIPYTFDALNEETSKIYTSVKSILSNMTIAEYEAPIIPDAILGAEARSERNNKLAATDYLMMLDYPISDEKRNEYKLYRQALRDITKQQDFPRNIIWPDKPVI